MAAAPTGSARVVKAAARVALLLIGDELLDGRIVDTNGPYFAERLRERSGHLAIHRALAHVDDELSHLTRLHPRAFVFEGRRRGRDLRFDFGGDVLDLLPPIRG